MKTVDFPELTGGKKIYFASDFHLGAPGYQESRFREEHLVRWLENIRCDAQALFLVGDLFDFWFEYKTAVPKGFIRFQGKLAELADQGIDIHLFTGNHDMWMFDYFEKEIGAKIHREPIEFSVAGRKLLVGHGDGLGPGDRFYKVLKRIFANRVCQWLFGFLHPTVGMGIATAWSGHSRVQNHGEEVFLGEEEWIWQYCRDVEAENHHDYYIFGHRHLPIDMPVGSRSRYINLGEWVSQYQYAVFDGKEVCLKKYECQ